MVVFIQKRCVKRTLHFNDLGENNVTLFMGLNAGFEYASRVGWARYFYCPPPFGSRVGWARYFYCPPPFGSYFGGQINTCPPYLTSSH